MGRHTRKLFIVILVKCLLISSLFHYHYKATYSSYINQFVLCIITHMISVHKLIRVDFLDNQSKLERFVFNLYTRVIVIVKEESGEGGGGEGGRLRLQAN